MKEKIQKIKCPECDNIMDSTHDCDWIIKEARTDTWLANCSDCGFFYGKHS